jgi:MOSC domain-containing protein YiiM
VAQLNAGSGGVPKTATPTVDVDFGGVVGDVQKSRQHHGRPWQALCIWSADVIDAFNADGHHLFPGAAGENVTVRGLHWPDVRPGVRLQLGGVLCEVSAYAFPCKQNTAWFRDGDFMAMWSGNGPVSRLYATVLQPGRIATGDAAILEP